MAGPDLDSQVLRNGISGMWVPNGALGLLALNFAGSPCTNGVILLPCNPNRCRPIASQGTF